MKAADDLTRETATRGRSQRHIPHLDGWRGLAIIVVLIGHFVPGVPEAGSLGVELFFVLSGRLMAKILIDDRSSLPRFFLHRFSRVYPTMLIFVTIIFFVSLVATLVGKHSNSFIGPLDYVAAVTLWMNYKVAFFGEAGSVDHLWSLSVEEHCYIALAVLAAAFARRRIVGVATVLMGAAALVNGYMLSRGGHNILHEVYWRSDVRLAPVFLSFSIYLWRDRLARLLGWLAVPCFAIGLAVPFVGLALPLQMAITALSFGIAVNGIDFAPEWTRRPLQGRLLLEAGAISYSLYLWQEPFFTLHGHVSAFLLVPAAVVVGWASCRYIERPSRRWLNDRWQRRHLQEARMPAG